MKTALFLALVALSMVAIEASGRLVGGHTEMEEGPERQRLLKLAEKRINSASNSFYKDKIFQVNSVKSQVGLVVISCGCRCLLVVYSVAGGGRRQVHDRCRLQAHEVHQARYERA